jgi:replicative DNA helicase
MLETELEADALMMEPLLPPHNLDIEQNILGGILQKPELMAHTIGQLETGHFYQKQHQVIFSAMAACFEQNAPIEPNSLAETLKASKTYEMAGGATYLYDLQLACNFNVPDEIALRYCVRKLRDLAQRRKVIHAGQEMQEAASDRSREDYMEAAQNLLYVIADAEPEAESLNPIDEAIEQLEAEASQPNGVTGLSTGFPTLDRSTHGFQPWQLITVSARPGGGKSAFALNVATHVVRQERKPVLYISLEMTAAELMKRAIKAQAGNSSDMQALRASAMAWQPFRPDLMIEDAAGQTLSAIQAKILKAKKKRPDLALVIVDHIGLIAPEAKAKSQNRAYEIQEITSRLKTLAKGVQVPILQLAQMNRGVEARQDKQPMLSDLRDSGSIEMDSDIVLFTSIERYDDRSPSGNATLSIAKQRDGVQMDIKLWFMPHLTLFKEI